MSMTVTCRHLEPRPDSAYRQLFVKGTRIRAELLYRAYVDPEQPMSPQELAVDFGVLLEAVYEAIDYVRSNPTELDEDTTHEQSLMAARGQLEPTYKYDARPRPLAPQDTVRLHILNHWR